MKLNADSVLFDLDGTLWDATQVVLKAWNTVIASWTTGKMKMLADKDMQGVMGMQLPEIGRTLFPQMAEQERMKIMEECCDYECTLIRKEGGRLFDGLEETLQALSTKIPLSIVSNCQKGYLDAFLEFHGLGKYFSDFEYARTGGVSKGDNILAVIGRNRYRRPVYIGDTEGDRVSTRHAGIPFIFAAYGFGSPREWDRKIDRVTELPQLLL